MGGEGGLLASGVSVAVGNCGGGVGSEGFAKGGVVVAILHGAVGGSQQADAAEAVLGIVGRRAGGVGD